MIENISDNGELLAILIKNSYNKPGISFFTPDEFSQQVAYMKYDSGKVIQPHVHTPVPREVKYTEEVLIIKKGKLRVDFYSNAKVYLKSRILEAGDFLLLVMGGHGFEVIEPLEMIEVKQGPYVGEKDKIRFEAAANISVETK